MAGDGLKWITAKMQQKRHRCCGDKKDRPMHDDSPSQAALDRRIDVLFIPPLFVVHGTYPVVARLLKHSLGTVQLSGAAPVPIRCEQTRFVCTSMPKSRSLSDVFCKTFTDNAAKRFYHAILPHVVA